MDNVIGKNGQIKQIIQTFEKKRKLGLLMTPVCYSGGVFTALAWDWSATFPATVRLAGRLGIHTDISEEKYAYAQGATFWCRTKAMRKLFDAGLEAEDFPAEPSPLDGTIEHAMERILPYVAQDAGYYTGIVESSESAARRVCDFGGILQRLMSKINVPASGNYYNYIRNLERGELLDFVHSFEKIYIYGHGHIAHQTQKMLAETDYPFMGFVVSDGRDIPDTDEKVVHLSEIQDKKQDIGFVVALSGYYQREVVPGLREKGFEHIYVI